MTFGHVSIYVFLAPRPNAKARKEKVLEVSSGVCRAPDLSSHVKCPLVADFPGVHGPHAPIERIGRGFSLHVSAA